MSIEELNRNMELEEVITKSDGTSIENKNMLDTPSHDHIRIIRGNVCSDRRMSYDRLFLVAIFIMVIILLILVFCMFAMMANQNSNSKNKTVPFIKDRRCTTKACLQAALSILNSINFSANPCEDFKEYSCGQWEKSIILPPGTSKFSPFEEIAAKMFLILRTLINSFDFQQSTESEKKLKKFYKSCIDTNVINHRGVEPFVTYINKTFSKYGGWQLLPDNTGFSIDSWSLKDVLENVFTDLIVTNLGSHDDYKNNKMKQLFILPGSLILDKELLLKNDNKELLMKYKEYMSQLLRIFKIDVEAHGDLLNDIINLEIQLAESHPNRIELRSIAEQYHISSIEDLNQNICKIFNWTRILETRYIKWDNKNLKIIVAFPKLLNQSCEVLKLYMTDNKNKSIIHNQMIWRMLSNRAHTLSDEARRAELEFTQYINGVTGIRPRWKTCVAYTLEYMPSVLASIFIRKYFNPQTKPQVMEMIELLREQFRYNLKNYDWMDEETKKNALHKLNRMIPFIGYTPEIMDKNLTHHLFKNIDINETLFFENVLEFHHTRLIESYKKVGFPSENTTIERPLEVNAYYNPSHNEITFPAGILQPPFFDPGVPRSLKYAGIGTAIGHEIGHGFDDKGSLFDADGNVNNWRTNATKEQFDIRAKCIVNQYGKYKFRNKTLNAKLSLGEDIADNGGVRLAYQVYKKLQEQYGPEPLLPGLDLTHDQLFFIGFARLWCNVETNENVEQNIRNDPHTPNKYRVVGVVSNMKEFSNAFNCPIGSKMNPYKKCRLW